MTCKLEHCLVTDFYREILKKLVLNVKNWNFTACLFPGKIHLNLMTIQKPNITFNFNYQLWVFRLFFQMMMMMMIQWLIK